MKYLIIIPALFIGSLTFTLFLGIMPTLVIDAFIPNFHYSAAAVQWVRYAGMGGAIAGPILTAIALWQYT